MVPTSLAVASYCDRCFKAFPKKIWRGHWKIHGLWMPRELQPVSSPAGLQACAGLGVFIAAPFVPAIGASLAGIEKVDGKPEHGEFRLWVRQVQKDRAYTGVFVWPWKWAQWLSLPPAPFHWHCKVVCTSTACVIGPLFPPPPFWPPRKLHQWLALRTLPSAVAEFRRLRRFKCCTEQRVLKTILGKLNEPRNSPPETTKQGKC